MSRLDCWANEIPGASPAWTRMAFQFDVADCVAEQIQVSAGEVFIRIGNSETFGIKPVRQERRAATHIVYPVIQCHRGMVAGQLVQNPDREPVVISEDQR
ncbi:hypothetical protein ASE29_21300 [Ensifer sp. Root74]|nr:hypothetical protein ASD49_24930 [Ensifer sp. Root1298]KQX91843.1 hypothetical protein ASD41_23620 [Ensifer sp. Root1312]KRC26835.1 hypothetical protein ASE29_21300 [Ensifer sp. Root74]